MRDIGKNQMRGIAMAAIAVSAALAVGQTPENPARAVSDPGVVTTLQQITPAGVQSVFNGRIYGIAYAGSTSTLDVALNTGDFYELDWQHNQVAKSFRGKSRPGMQGIAWDPVTGAPMLSGSAANAGRLVRVTGMDETVLADHLGTFTFGGVAVAPEKNSVGERYAVVALTYNDSLAIAMEDAFDLLHVHGGPRTVFCHRYERDVGHTATE